MHFGTRSKYHKINKNLLVKVQVHRNLTNIFLGMNTMDPYYISHEYTLTALLENNEVLKDI